MDMDCHSDDATQTVLKTCQWMSVIIVAILGLQFASKLELSQIFIYLADVV